MSLPPIEKQYQCERCNHEFSISVRAFAVTKRVQECRSCGFPSAKLMFDNELQRQSAQKESVRRAGDCLVNASKELNASVVKSESLFSSHVTVDKVQFEMATKHIDKAGEYLRNLP